MLVVNRGEDTLSGLIFRGFSYVCNKFSLAVDEWQKEAIKWFKVGADYMTRAFFRELIEVFALFGVF